MNIALDYDGTFTADPELWHAFIKLAKSRGHRVSIVTGRRPEERILENIDAPIIFCSRTAKRSHAPDIDVWIDDNPQNIYLEIYD